MGTKTFNIEDSLYESFSKVHRGDMSKIVSQLITNYISIKKENLELSKLKQQLEDIQQKITQLKQEKSNIKLLVSQLEEEYAKKVQEEKETDTKVVNWARDCIRDAKNQGSYTELQYEAEMNNYTDVEKYLINKWHNSQEDE